MYLFYRKAKYFDEESFYVVDDDEEEIPELTHVYWMDDGCIALESLVASDDNKKEYKLVYSIFKRLEKKTALDCVLEWFGTQPHKNNQ